MINKEQIKALIDYIKVYEEFKEELNVKTIKFNKENEDLIKDIGRQFQHIELIKDDIKADARVEYMNNQNKKLLGGISIREGIRLKYDESDAVGWAKTNMPVAIKEVIDKKMFEAYVKSNELEFVHQETKITVCFPKEIKLEDNKDG